MLRGMRIEEEFLGKAAGLGKNEAVAVAELEFQGEVAEAFGELFLLRVVLEDRDGRPGETAVFHFQLAVEQQGAGRFGLRGGGAQESGGQGKHGEDAEEDAVAAHALCAVARRRRGGGRVRFDGTNQWLPKSIRSRRCASGGRR